jgi:hypothetical protein
MPDLTVKVGQWMQDAKRVAVGYFRQVLENDAEYCSSENDSEGEEQDNSVSMGSVSKESHRISENQALALRAATHYASEQTESTAQAHQAAGSRDPTIQAPTSSSPLAPTVSDAEVSVPEKIMKKKGPTKKKTQGRAGGLDTVGAQGAMDTRATRRRPSDTLPRETPF